MIKILILLGFISSFAANAASGPSGASAPISYCSSENAQIQYITGDSAAKLYQFLVQENPSAAHNCGPIIKISIVGAGSISCIYDQYQTDSPYTCGFGVNGDGSICSVLYTCPNPRAGVGN